MMWIQLAAFAAPGLRNTTLFGKEFMKWKRSSVSCILAARPVEDLSSNLLRSQANWSILSLSSLNHHSISCSWAAKQFSSMARFYHSIIVYLWTTTIMLTKQKYYNSLYLLSYLAALSAFTKESTSRRSG